MNPATATPCDHLDSLLGKVAEEFLQQLARGEQPDVERYATDHPDIAALIRQTFPALRVVSDSLSEGDGGGGIDLSRSKQLGDFRLLHELGSGGMGFVGDSGGQSILQSTLHEKLCPRPLPRLWLKRRRRRRRLVWLAIADRKRPAPSALG